MPAASKPQVVCLMLSSVDGRLHPSRYTASPDGTRKQWSGIYEQLHDRIGGDAWLVGRVTMAEMTGAAAHPPAAPSAIERPVHVARSAETYAVALDPSGRLHFERGDLDGDHVVVLLGRNVADDHLAELAGDGVSYIVAEQAEIDLAAMLATLGDRFGIRRLLLEGGAGVNGSFLAAGLVDELNVLVAPALDGGEDVRGIVAAGTEGLAGKVRLSFKDATPLAHGVVHLRYAVAPG
jgi:riboflavin biosynthesis pyrimidine reductase